MSASDHWRNEYVHMARQHGREIRRTIKLADAFTDWLVEKEHHNPMDAAEIVAELYETASKESEAE